MTERRPLQLVVVSEPGNCSECNEPLELGSDAYWWASPGGVVRRWHTQCDKKARKREEVYADWRKRGLIQ